MGKARSVSSIENEAIRRQKELSAINNQLPDNIAGPFQNFPEAPTAIPKALLIEGGMMKGPIAFKDSLLTISSGKINVGRTTPGYASFIVISAESGTIDDLTDIDNPAFPGQVVFLQADTGDTITIKTTGNMDTTDGVDFILNAEKVAEFIYTQKSGEWEQIGASGGGISFPIEITVNDHEDTWTSPVAIDLSASDAHVHKFTLDGDLTLTFTNIPADETQIEFELEFLQDGTGGHTVTFPSEVVETLSVNETANKLTIFTLRVNDGTNVHAITTLAGNISGGGGSGINNIVEDVTPQLGGDLDVQTFDILMKGQSVFYDTDADTHLTAAVDDILKVTVGGTPTVDFLAGSIFFQGGINIDMNGNDIILDVDNDSKINVNGDDDYRFEASGNTIALVDGTSFTINLALDFLTNGVAQTTVNGFWADANGLFLNVISGDKFEVQAAGNLIANFSDTVATIKQTLSGGATFNIFGNDATPNDADVVAVLQFNGADNLLAETSYARLVATSRDVTSTSIDGELKVQIKVASTGSWTDIVQFIATKVDMLADLDMNTFDIDFSTHGHSIETDTTIFRIDVGSVTDLFEIQHGGNPTLEIVGLDTDFGSNTTARFSCPNNLEMYLQLYRIDTITADNLTIAKQQFLYGPSGTEDVYAEIEALTRDVTAATLDAALKLKIISGSSLSTMIDLNSTTGGTKQIGFFGVTPVAQQSPASNAAAIITALEALGLFV